MRREFFTATMTAPGNHSAEWMLSMISDEEEKPFTGPLADLLEKRREVSRAFVRDLQQLEDEVEAGRLSPDQYEERRIVRRDQFFADDTAVAAQITRRARHLKASFDLPAWQSTKPRVQ